MHELPETTSETPKSDGGKKYFQNDALLGKGALIYMSVPQAKGTLAKNFFHFFVFLKLFLKLCHSGSSCLRGETAIWYSDSVVGVETHFVPWKRIVAVFYSVLYSILFSALLFFFFFFSLFSFSVLVFPILVSKRTRWCRKKDGLSGYLG